ncbi:MAG: hypothetical protein AAB877_00130, partial [Patescibacteria group bacterium]
IGLAAPIWREIMEKLLKSNPKENFTKPEPVKDLNPILMGIFPESVPPHSILYYINKNDLQNIGVENPGNDALYYNFEQGVQNYLNPPLQIISQEPTPTLP